MKPDDLSNIAYIIAGFALAVGGAYVPAFGLMFLGITSYIAHVKGGQWWYYDWAGMYIAMVAIILYNIGHPFYFWAVIAPIIVATVRYRFDSLTLTGALWCAVVASAYIIGIAVVVPVIIFALAIAIRQWGHDDHYQITHSIWHILAATGFYLLS